MIVEERCYILQPNATPQQFLAAYEANGRALQTRILGNLLGFFVTEVGQLNSLVHWWGYDSFEDRLLRRQRLAAEPGWQAYLDDVRPMLQSMSNRVLVPTSFSPIR